MATCASVFSNARLGPTAGWPLTRKFGGTEKFSVFENKNPPILHSGTAHPAKLAASRNIHILLPDETLSRKIPGLLSVARDVEQTTSDISKRLPLADVDPATAKVAISIVGPSLSVFGFLFILRIVMSWYPKLPVDKFPYVIAYAPTEPFLVAARKVIPPLAGVDVTPVVWFGLLSFLNEILVGPQGLLVLLSQQVR